MVFCSNCGKQLRDGAKYCDECGSVIDHSNQDPMVPFQGNQIIQSTRLYVSQQRLFGSLFLIGIGFVGLLMGALMPPFPSMDDPFGPATDYTMNTIFAVMGLVMMAIGAAIYFLGRSNQEQY
jgi:LPXTG-motif cell wall-anchored protein